ncbi:hypothetical protein AGDE_11865 [Angomonas deanei]|nr:hypothetical protein AGDE_11865 [Angomonas deanei]|eukprot:EPY25342.1 hypothetical protein AGDE_11865 [Angomonas deanei]
MSEHNNPIELLLKRLNLEDYIPAFKREGIERLVVLRKISDDKLAQLIPDQERRAALKEAIKSRGGNKNNRPNNKGPQALGTEPMPHDNDNVRRGRGRGGHNGGGRGRGIGVCRHFTQGNCKYGDECRYRHDTNEEAFEEVERREEDYLFNLTVTIPTSSIKYLLGSTNHVLGSIHEECETSNKIISHVDETQQKNFDLVLLGNNESDLQKAKEKILSAAGVKKLNERKDRFEYIKDELSFHTAAVKYLVAANKLNEGNSRHLSDSILKNIITGFRFQQPPDIQHFRLIASQSDKDKEEAIGKIIAQLKGVQAVVFVDQKRVKEMSDAKGRDRMARYFNKVTPLFLHRELTKEERFTVLEEFKKGQTNDNGVKERLLVTSDDYAKLARKTIIPFVNLVVHFTVPRTEEMYLVQSNVTGRQGTVGVSLLITSTAEDPAVP